MSVNSVVSVRALRWSAITPGISPPCYDLDRIAMVLSPTFSKFEIKAELSPVDLELGLSWQK